MRGITVIATTLLSALALLPDTLAQTADGEILKWSQLPACATTCGKLWDVQGACAPAGLTDTSKSCFCGSADLVPFTVGGPTPDGCCAAGAPTDLQKVKDWFTGYCKDVQKPVAGGTPTTSTGTGTKASGTKASGTSTASATSTKVPAVKDNRTWIQSHYQWVIMAVILLIAFIGGWIAACFFRKHHLAKRGMNTELKPARQTWVGTTDNTSPYAYGGGEEYGGGSGGFGKEEGWVQKQKKKWVVHERT